MKRGTDKYSLLFAAGNVTDIWNTGTNCTLIGYWINTNQLVVYDNGTVFRQTSQVFRDFSAWYHIVVAFDTTQATAANRLRVYINGAEVTSWDTNAAPTQNLDMAVNVNQNHFVGGQSTNVANAYFDGYLTEINFVDGQQLTPSSFGETDSITGVWKPKAYSGTYGTNGFELNFSDNSNNTAATIGKDYSGNGNNWTPNNISVTSGATYDSMVDSPTVSATSSNYAVLNPLAFNPAPGGTGVSTYSNGNLLATNNTASWSNCFSTIGVSSGKFYAEFNTGGGDRMVGIFNINTSVSSLSDYFGSSSSGYLYYSSGQKANGGSFTSYGASWANGDVIGVALDMDAGTVTFYKNNTSQGTAFSSLSGTFVFAITTYDSGSTKTANFGQQPFTYTPPSGFVALNTYNLPASTIKNGAAYMAATVYTGNSPSSQSISNAVNGVSFQPDFVWQKSRSQTYNHTLYDSVRGTTKELYSNLTSAEVTDTNGLTAFTSSGFTIGSDGELNDPTGTHVAWQWKAGTTSASNTNGTITSTVSVGATQGFSVVTYTGTGANATVGHGLGVAPQMFIVKMRSAGGNNWQVYHSALGQNKILQLDLTTSVDTITNYWYNGTTSTVFGVNGSYSGINSNGATYVAYCFSAVAGYSAFGSYTGNGSSDGPFVYLGFRPRWVMFKNTTTGAGWLIYDSSRNTYNLTDLYLQANQSNAEAGNSTDNPLDFLSNGFKLRYSNSATNASAEVYVYAAFAEVPFRSALAR